MSWQNEKKQRFLLNHMKETLKKQGVEPKAHLDQHFLKNDEVIDKIINFLEINNKDVIFEIGAGIGTITKRMKGYKRLIAVEIDKGLCRVLEKEIKENREINKYNIKVISDNALKAIDDAEFNKIISSTPYAICEPLIKKLFFAEFERAVLLLPKKFIEDIKSKKTKLGLLTEAFLDIKIVGEVSRKEFYPEPDAESVIVIITKINKKSIIKELYLQRDKKLKNALMNIFMDEDKITKIRAREKISALGIENRIMDKRVDQLNKKEYDSIIRIMK